LRRSRGNAGGPQVGTGETPGDGGLAADHADIDHAVEEDLVFIEQLGDFADGEFALGEELADRGFEAGRHVAELTSDAGEGGGETRPGELFAEVVDFLAFGEGVKEHGHRTHVHRADADSEHVGG
jgi:hypothetical protein